MNTCEDCNFNEKDAFVCLRFIKAADDVRLRWLGGLPAVGSNAEWRHTFQGSPCIPPRIRNFAERCYTYCRYEEDLNSEYEKREPFKKGRLAGLI